MLRMLSGFAILGCCAAMLGGGPMLDAAEAATPVHLSSSWLVGQEFNLKIVREKTQIDAAGAMQSLMARFDVRARVIAADETGSILRWEHRGDWNFSGDAIERLGSPADSIVDAFRKLSGDLHFEIQVDPSGKPFSLRNEEAVLLALGSGLDAAAEQFQETMPSPQQIELLQGLFRDYVTPELVLESTSTLR